MKKLAVLAAFALEAIKSAIRYMGDVKGEAPTREHASKKASAIASHGTNRPASPSYPLLNRDIARLQDKARKLLTGQVGYWAPEERALLRSRLGDALNNFSDEKLAQALLGLG